MWTKFCTLSVRVFLDIPQLLVFVCLCRLHEFQVKEVKETESRIKECHPPIWVLARGSTTEEETYLEPITRYHESTNIKYSDAWKTNESLKINK